tara:strand:- start:5117 stop:5344 length:228 start_codon:yes stop_codon:yes gene_type:complete
MKFDNYFEKDILAPAIDIGSDNRKFQRSIKFIKQDRYKAGVLFYLGEIQAAAQSIAAPTNSGAQQATGTTTQSGY